MASKERRIRQSDEPSVTQRIAAAVADVERSNATELNPPLGEVIDPEALERILAGTSGATHVRFRYRGLRITARADGLITVVEDGDA